MSFISARNKVPMGALLISLAISSCGLTQSRADQPEHVRMPGFTLVLQETEGDEIAKILGINRWHFGVQLDDEGEQSLHLTLIMVEPDGSEVIIDEISTVTGESGLNALAAVYPIDESLLNAERIRVYLELGGGSTSSVIDNPFKEFSSSYSANPADMLGDQTIELMAFSDSGLVPAAENTILALRLDVNAE